jgi:3-hydroxyacyl-CoA dehydrogenase
MGVVEVTVTDGIAWVVVDSPPVNATSTAVRAGLLRAVEQVQGARLAVLLCKGSTFIAGGDISEFGAPAQEPHMPQVADAIEGSETPFLALLHGTVLGGGLEVAMACAFRIAAPRTRFGLPEVNIGLIPGAGGTQRGPRLFGWEASIEMACRGRMIGTQAALDLGAIDAIVEDLEAAARTWNRPRPVAVSQRPTPPLPDGLIDAARADLTRTMKGQTAPLDTLEALTWAIRPYVESQPRERALHIELRQSAQSRALRHAFFAERAVAKPEGGGIPHPVGSVAVVGGGLMGAGIATACLAAGLSVTVIEQSADAAVAAHARVTALLDAALSRGKLTVAARDAQLAHLVSSDTFAAAKDADMAIEAVFEDTQVKRDVFHSLAGQMRGDAILATNTSYLDPRDIFAGVPGQERCLGLHFFSPAQIMKLVEVIPLPETSADTLATAFAFSKGLRKVPVWTGICDGFIGNRMLAAYRRAAEYLLADGALPHQIDSAMTGYGMAMGPFAAQDMSGLQIAQLNRRRQDATRPAQERYVPIADRVVAAGRIGARFGGGWYAYPEGPRKPVPAPEVEEIITAYSAEAGAARQRFIPEQISEMMMAALTNEGARIVDEGIAADDAAVDIVQMLGYGFPRWRGGPMFATAQDGGKSVRAGLDALDHYSPQAFPRAERYR